MNPTFKFASIILTIFYSDFYLGLSSILEILNQLIQYTRLVNKFLIYCQI